MPEQKMIPCPWCAKIPAWVEVDGRPVCGLCADRGTILDRRAPSAAERAVDALRAWALRYMQEYDGTDDARMRDAADVVLDIIREEAARG